jgi:hypothetical protein
MSDDPIQRTENLSLEECEIFLRILADLHNQYSIAAA